MSYLKFVLNLKSVYPLFTNKKDLDNYVTKLFNDYESYLNSNIDSIAYVKYIYKLKDMYKDNDKIKITENNCVKYVENIKDIEQYFNKSSCFDFQINVNVNVQF